MFFRWGVASFISGGRGGVPHRGQHWDRGGGGRLCPPLPNYSGGRRSSKLFIVFFLRSHFGRLFHVSMNAVCFSDGGASFIIGGSGVPHRGVALVLWGGVQKKL